MNGDFISIRGLSLTRRMVLQGMASLLGCAVTPSAFAATAKSCKLTERDIIGPFYRFGAPYQTKLAGPNEPGERLMMTGTVYSSDCRSRLPNTLIEIWQANKAGLYDTDKPGNFTGEHVDFHNGVMIRYLDFIGIPAATLMIYSEWSAVRPRARLAPHRQNLD